MFKNIPVNSCSLENLYYIYVEMGTLTWLCIIKDKNVITMEERKLMFFQTVLVLLPKQEIWQNMHILIILKLKVHINIVFTVQRYHSGNNGRYRILQQLLTVKGMNDVNNCWYNPNKTF